MRTRIQKWGNSQGLRLARSVLDDAGLGVGDDVNVAVRDGVIVVAPAGRVRGKYCLEELVARIRRGYKPREVDWGGPVGEEVW